MIDMKEITAVLRGVYGPKEGQRVALTVMPGILADFQGMLKKAAAGERLREEYRTEDGKAVIALEGCRLASGALDVRARVHTFG